MRKYLRLILLINVVLISTVSVFARDTLKLPKHNLIVSFNYGIPVYNKLLIYSSDVYNDNYYVNSKLKSCYEFSIIDNYKKVDSINDSLKTLNKQRHLYVSGAIGIPVYNNFVYKNDVNQKNYTANSKSKIQYSLNLDYVFNHFNLNFLTNYSENEFSGNSYKLTGPQLNAGSHNVPIYKYFEMYQRVQYNYLQVGCGLGYNKWYKKNNFSLTINLMYNLVTNVKISSYFTPNSSYNDNDTIQIRMVKNLKLKDVNSSLALYGNLKFSYSYLLNKRVMLLLSLSASYGFLDNYSHTGAPSSGNNYFGYYLYHQKIIYPSVGIKYKLH